MGEEEHPATPAYRTGDGSPDTFGQQSLSGGILGAIDHLHRSP